eukprot:11820005-Alexandrium_andersonii.AAC.1
MPASASSEHSAGWQLTQRALAELQISVRLRCPQLLFPVEDKPLAQRDTYSLLVYLQRHGWQHRDWTGPPRACPVAQVAAPAKVLWTMPGAETFCHDYLLCLSGLEDR